ncbi:hypothetical protein LY76DRAFT_419434 [Colletotrichum caudatum]|nr:hypothetical protein LY76DRAFT_419434 [Colletotrichum caudatum]
MSTPRSNSINPGQDASPARPSNPGTPSTKSTSLASDRADLSWQTPSAPDQSAGTAATSPPPAPKPSRFRNADSLPMASPWPVSPIRPDGRLCLHQDVYPCFCRDVTDLQGHVCRRCVFEGCPVNAKLHYGMAEVVRRAREAEAARRREGGSPR